MLNILKDKRVWIGLAIALLFVIGIISTIYMINQSEKKVHSEKDTVKIETDKDENANNNQDEPYDGEGMEVVEDNTESEDTMEVPESWEDSSETNNKSDENGTVEDSDKGNSNKEDNKQQEENTEDIENESNENTLKDETTEWGSIF